MMIHFWENTFWAINITSLSYLEGQTLCTLMIFRHVPFATGTSLKAVWWTISDKTHFGLKHYLSFEFRWQNSAHPLKFSGMYQFQWYKFQNCTMIHFWEKTFWAINITLLSYLEGQTQHNLMIVQACANSNWYKFQSCMMIHFWENTFWAKTSPFLSYLEGQTQHTLKLSGMPIAMVQVWKTVW